MKCEIISINQIWNKNKINEYYNILIQNNIKYKICETYYEFIDIDLNSLEELIKLYSILKEQLIINVDDSNILHITIYDDYNE